MAYVESTLISRTGYGDASFDADVRSAYRAKQGVSGAMGDLSSFVTDNAGLLGGAAAVYFLFFHKKKR